MRRLLIALLLLPIAASAQVYRWTDKAGTVHYSNEAPPQGVKATKLAIEAKPGIPSPDTQDCYTVRCQGERMEARIAQREAAQAQARADREAAAASQPHGLEFRRYISI